MQHGVADALGRGHGQHQCLGHDQHAEGVLLTFPHTLELRLSLLMHCLFTGSRDSASSAVCHSSSNISGFPPPACIGTGHLRLCRRHGLSEPVHGGWRHQLRFLGRCAMTADCWTITFSTICDKLLVMCVCMAAADRTKSSKYDCRRCKCRGSVSAAYYQLRLRLPHQRGVAP